jgi:hypothetical protein
MTAPTKNRFDPNAVDGGEQSAKQMSSAEASNRSERVTQLHNEIFARGVLPVSQHQRSRPPGSPEPGGR